MYYGRRHANTCDLQCGPAKTTIGGPEPEQSRVTRDKGASNVQKSTDREESRDDHPSTLNHGLKQTYRPWTLINTPSRLKAHIDPRSHLITHRRWYSATKRCSRRTSVLPIQKFVKSSFPLLISHCSALVPDPEPISANYFRPRTRYILS